MRILIYSTPVFALGPMGLTGYGGLEAIAWECAKGLAKRGHQVGLIAPDNSVCPGVQVFHCGPERVTDEPKFWDKAWQHLLLGWDAIIDHSWQKLSLKLKQEGRLTCPVLNVHHAPVNTMWQKLPDETIQGQFQNKFKFCAVCISEDQKNHFEAIFNRPARSCYNGIDPEYYRPLGLPRTNRYLFLGRFSTIKGPDLAIEACNASGAELDICGDTQITQEPELYTKCMAMADGKKIKVIGNQPRGNCVWLYSQAKALLHPVQRFREPFGLAPVEAMACGCPTIAWANGAMKETIKHGETGFLVNSHEELVDLIKTNAVDSIDREKCREWAIQFSVDRMAKAYESLCQEAIKTGGW
jgi:glycosyltransferase involved in cell wall biosynthesis